jgi:alcohol dehydrogenase (cytochrome c)
MRIRFLVTALVVAMTSLIATPVLGAPAVEWPGYNGAPGADRYSPLRQITPANVASLIEVARYQLPETTSFQSGLVAVGGALFFTTATSTYAVDWTTGKLLWSHKYQPKSLGLGTPVRGVAYSKGRLYRGSPDAHVYALDAATGKVLWDVAAFSTEKGEYVTAVPVVWKDRLFIGNSGSDVGAIGHIRALALKDGRALWNFDVVPGAGPGSDTWPSDPAKVKAGGGLYSSFALDIEDGDLFTPAGNPGPDFDGDYRPGDNLYTCSVLKLDGNTGALLAHYQTVKHDVHDWDIAASPILFTSKAGRKMVAVGTKSGYLFGFDRNLSKVAYRVPVTTIDNVDAPLTAAGTRFCPGTQGGVNWNGPAYSALDNALYVNSIDWCTTITRGGPESVEHKYGAPFLGSSNAFGDSPMNERSGWLYAVDADSGNVMWKYHSSQPLVAAVTPTAGGVVFTGDLLGNLLAFDSKSGRLLLEKGAGDPIGGGIITYEVDGRQYLAAAVGMKGEILKTDSGPATVVIYSLPSK